MPAQTWTTGEVVTAAKMTTLSAQAWTPQLAYTEFTASVSITATVEATPNDVVSSGAITYTADPILIEFSAVSAVTGASAGAELFFDLWDDTTNLGRIAAITGNSVRVPVRASRRLTPTAASHTYKVRVWRSVADGSVEAGAGGTGIRLPGYIRITRA